MAAPMLMSAVMSRKYICGVVLVQTLKRKTLKISLIKGAVRLESVFDSIVPQKEDVKDSTGANDNSQSEAKTQTDESIDDDDSTSEDGESKLFSLTSVIKTLLNPVIGEFQVGSEEEQETEKVPEPVVIETVTPNITAETANVTVSDNSTAKNETDGSKKYKFQCIGRNITENTTLEVRLVNSTTLLEVLSFDKNRTTGDCVLVMFYAPWCQFCAKTAPHYNALARAYPQLEVLAVDAVHFSNLNARFGTVAVPNVMLFHQSRSAVRFNHTERVFNSFIQFIKNVTGLEPNTTVNVTDQDFQGPLPSVPTEDPDYLLWMAWVFVLVCSSYIFVNSHYGQQSINRVRVLWQEHQHIE
ncbi:thioredoxin domain-containing protein 15-like [Haliotis rubra]|uniref:thioredoxin domain-containing protein 15-like n=1 Tax=Haliotis rubra TaxID=36100 RepID=UPI001EE57609|nr:thioredoxin domain-containing protein 15-like [Haliotis rubra]